MKILLLTRNHVVREFIELVADRVGAGLDVLGEVPEAGEIEYDVLFVDDRGTLLEESITLLDTLEPGQSVVLYAEENALHDFFDHQVKKPFLPSDIQQILEQDTLSSAQPIEEQVLNIQDIEEIRGLLEREGLEIVAEEELVDEIDREPLVEEEDTTMEEKLLAAISSMEPKKIRKLLRGAEVTLRIRFPKEES